MQVFFSQQPKNMLIMKKKHDFRIVLFLINTLVPPILVIKTH
jgi:hypothetical protein